MTETTTPSNGSAPAAAPNVNPRVLSQYIRDLSFQNMLAKKGLTGDPQQEISVQVNLESGRRGGDNRYEVITKLNITNNSKSSGEPLFLLEIEYAGLFQIEGLTAEQLQPLLLIECPRITFPYLRRIVGDVTLDGGFPPLILDTIDFVSLYRKELARRAQSDVAEAAAPQKLDS